jgi:preprotein translocase subunit SecG
MATLLSILIFLAAILLILVVLIQNPKGGGLASEFSSANQIGGVQETADFLERATWTLAVGIMVLTLMRAGFVSSGSAEEEQEGDPLEEVIDEQMNRQTPMTPSRGGQRGQGDRGGQGDASGRGAASGQGEGGGSAVEEAIEGQDQEGGEE